MNRRTDMVKDMVKFHRLSSKSVMSEPEEESAVDSQLLSLLEEFNNPVATSALERIKKQNNEIARLQKEVRGLKKHNFHNKR